MHFAIGVDVYNDLLIGRQVFCSQSVCLRINRNHHGPDVVEGSKHHLLRGIVAAVVTLGSERTQLVANFQPGKITEFGVGKLD